MNVATILKGVKEGAKFVGLVVQRHLPEILLAGSIAAGIATVYLVSKETKGAQEVIERHERERKEIPDFEKAEIGKLYLKTAGRMAKNYAPAIATGTLSIAFSLGSFGVLRRRNIALLGAAKAISDAYAEYRNRVKEKLGEEKELDIFHNAKYEKVEQIGEDGKKKKKEIRIFDEESFDNEFGRYYDNTCTNWKPDPILAKNNLFLAKCGIEDELASRPKNHPYFVNELYTDYNMPLSSEGFKWGWDWNDLGKVDLNIEEGYRRAIEETEEGYIPVIRMIPNCHPLKGWV